MDCIYVVPITNLVLDHPFKHGEFYIYPQLGMKTEYYKYNPIFMNTIEEEEHNYYCSLIDKIHLRYPRVGNGDYAHIFFIGEYIEINSAEESFWLVDKLSKQADIGLNFLRLEECVIGNFEQLPGIAGILDDAIKSVFRIITDEKENIQIELINGRVSLTIKDGMGCYPSGEFLKSDYDSPLYQALFGERNDEIVHLCQSALNRVCNVFYMQDFDVAFVYLMSTIEMIADPKNYIAFKRVKSKIIPFIVDSKEQYHQLSDKMKNISENIRTEIVHKGKSLYELFETRAEVITILNKLISIIIKYTTTIMELGIRDFPSLEIERQNRILRLGV